VTVAGANRTLNIEHRTLNIEVDPPESVNSREFREFAGLTSMFDVQCSMFDVRFED